MTHLLKNEEGLTWDQLFHYVIVDSAKPGIVVIPELVRQPVVTNETCLLQPFSAKELF